MSTHIVSPLESTVEQHIDSTSRLMRRVDLALALLIVISLLLGGLFLAVLADHWLLKDGLSMPLRLAIFAALAAAAGLYIYWKIVPILRYQINPVYTADLIEKDVHTFKNSLINWLLLRQEREERANVPQEKIHDRMFDGIVKTAAANVRTVPAGHAVDLRKLIWAGTFFAVLLIMFAAYAAFSPKNPLTSIWRVLIPVANIDRPQAAQFRNVQPGDTTALQGETLNISAEVVSQSIEPVYLVFSTDDGQAVNQRIPMSLPEGKKAFETQFPPGRQGSERGFNSSVDYWIAQGESRSKQYRIEVLPAASVEIVSLQYVYPDYTGLPPETVEHGGDVKALEGTSVTVAVRSTLPLDKINLVFDNNPSSGTSMRITNAEKTEARGTFVLKHPYPYQTFSFQAVDANGNASRRSGIYRIEVIPDQPPKVQWADTATNLREVARLDLPINETLPLPIQAEDPDFALRYLRFKMELTGHGNEDKRVFPAVELITSPSTGATEHRGQIRKLHTFSPQTARLAPGDTVEVWAEATDTKLPEANVSETRKITITVVEPKKDDEPNAEKEQEGNGENQPDNQNQDNQNKENDSQEDTKGEGGEGNEGGKSNEDNPDGQDSGEKNNPEDQNSGGEGEPDPNNPQQDPDNRQPAGNDSQEGEQRNGNDGQGGGTPQGGEPDGSNEGAGNDPAGTDGTETEEGTFDNGTESNAASEQSPDGTQQGNGMDGEQTDDGQSGAEQSGGGQEQNMPVNHQTQDGDAMDRIANQMRREGKLDDKAVQEAIQRKRDESLDPDSKNRSETGSDPSNPGESNKTPKNGGQPEGEKPVEKPGEGNGEESGASPESGQEGTESGQPTQGEQGGQQNGQESGQQNGQESGQQNGQQPSAEGQQGNSGGEPQSVQEGAGAGQQSQQGSEGANPNSGEQPSGQQGQQSGSGEGGAGTTQPTTPDDPNLEYANQVANMVLEYLEDQLKEKPSDDLLKDLGWSEEELRQFHARWKAMSENSKNPVRQEGDKSDWWEALKSWGVRPNQDGFGVRGSRTAKVDASNTEAIRTPVPQTMWNRFRTYTENLGK